MKIETRINVIVFLKSIPEIILVLLDLLFLAWLTQKYIETLCFAISFCFLRYKFNNIFHCKTTLLCILFTNSAAIIFVPLSLSIGNSLFGGILSAFVLNYISNLIAANIARKNELNQLNDLKAKERQFNICEMNEQELREYCKLNMLDEIDEEIIIYRLIHKLKGKNLYDKIGYSKSQMIRRERKIEKQLNIKLKNR